MTIENVEVVSTKKTSSRQKKRAVGCQSSQIRTRSRASSAKPRQLNTRTRVESVSDDENGNANIEFFSRVTRSGDSIVKLIKRIERILESEEAPDMDSLNCVICCENKNI